MDGLYDYVIFEILDPTAETDDNGDPLDVGWYYCFCQPEPGRFEPIGPFTTSGRAEAAAEAEVEEFASV